jgi:hypothetical protein
LEFTGGDEPLAQCLDAWVNRVTVAAATHGSGISQAFSVSPNGLARRTFPADIRAAKDRRSAPRIFALLILTAVGYLGRIRVARRSAIHGIVVRTSGCLRKSG